jgi:hypothetical protein
MTATTARTAKPSSSREAWLNAFIAAARPVFAARGYEIPAKVRASIGFTSVGLRGKRIGECWSDQASADATFEIFIVPGMDDAERVADILTHELIHAAVGLKAGHGPKFGACARAMGLEGKLTATVAGDSWRAWARPILKRLGALPHAKLTGATSGPKKQTTRMLKAECDECGFTVRGSRAWLCEATDDGDVRAKVLRCPDLACAGFLLVALGGGEDGGE